MSAAVRLEPMGLMGAAEGAAWQVVQRQVEALSVVVWSLAESRAAALRAAEAPVVVARVVAQRVALQLAAL